MRLAILAVPSPNGNLQLLVSGIGVSPVAASAVLNAELLTGRLQITVSGYHLS